MIWNCIKTSRPLATERGCWDGLRSDKVLVCDMNRKYHVATMYEGSLDGVEFCDFYDESDYEIKNVAYWTEISNAF